MGVGPTGNSVKNGPDVFFLWPHLKRKWRNSAQLGPLQYAIIRNNRGQVRHEIGPALYFLGPYDELVELKEKVVLQKDQYIRLVDRLTGSERVLQGPHTVIPDVMEQAPNGTEKAVIIDDDVAVLVLDKHSGEQRLESTKGVFVPGPYERILSQQTLIRVLPHQAVVVRDAKGYMDVRSGQNGNGTGFAFFLPPYTRVFEMEWTSYAHVDHAANGEKIFISKIDLRSKKMFFQYDVRTSDNVKLQLEGTIFWKIHDVSMMVKTTSDPEGDVWQHARSNLIQAVSKVTLAKFMADFNNITMEAFREQAEDGFYKVRGVEVGSMELTRYVCLDKKTADILEDIIQETTHRLNRLQQQKSENDINAAKLQSEIELERKRTALIQTRADNARLEASSRGDAGGLELMREVAAFVNGLNDTLPNVENRIDLYKLHETLKSKDAGMHSLASGNATLFLTPQDVDLKFNIGTGLGRSLSEL